MITEADLNVRKQMLLKYLGKPVHVVVDRPIGYRHGDTVYPVNYGYIPGMIGGDGEEQDTYILGVTSNSVRHLEPCKDLEVFFNPSCTNNLSTQKAPGSDDFSNVQKRTVSRC